MPHFDARFNCATMAARSRSTAMADSPSVVITGASTGIGKACALHLARRGWRVFAGVRRDADGAALSQALQPAGPGALAPVRLDVTDGASIAAAAAQVAGALGDAPLHGLVNNAGIVVAGPLEYVPIDELQRVFAINVTGQIAVTQAFLPLLRRAIAGAPRGTGGRARIVNMSSVSGLMTLPFMGPYSASKFALEALSDALRMELRPWGIHVAVIEPGQIATSIWEKSLAWADTLEQRLPPEARQRYGPALDAVRARAARLGQLGAPAENVARLVAHALTARAPRQRYVTGRSAGLRHVFRLLPGELRDWIIAQRLPRYP
jgi:NAD(P)-dependent dehydrogenase (short-subunit alcohol dehydrogenase family)